ncbi:pyridoxamine 5'-phosphate oxidase family protein [Ramlibacter sp.]|uniref:pyridoxamine 5'-phosphate oxidase family protein n=1 Tax=Ramlibacter sp. TaxID=1917967 RepID=UPI003D0E761B
MSHDNNTDSHEKLWELIKDTKFGMLAHRHADGRLHSHPLTTQNKTLAADGILYFFVSRKTEMGQRLRQDGNVNISYAHLDKDSWVSVSGTATISEDMAKKKELFNPIAKAWFPGGVEDPDLELLEVRIHDAEYWDVKQSKLRQLFTMAKAAVTGKPPHDLGEHKELHLN